MSATRLSPLTSGSLLASSAGLTGLAIYQWLELIAVRSGHTPACAINDTVNCATVWNSPFAHAVHDVLGIPVAGLGVLWGLVAVTLTLLTMQRAQADGDASPFVSGLKVWASAGLLSCVLLAAASLRAQAVCLTCLGTYALVLLFALSALKYTGESVLPSTADVLPGTGWALVLTVPLYLGLLYPGARTPKGNDTLAVAPSATGNIQEDFAALVRSMPEREKLSTSWAREQWKQGTLHDTTAFPAHTVKGNALAPVKLVEFTDILCGHCARFEELLHEIERVSPRENMSIEPRYYPLDEECNPDIKGSAKNGVRCYGARLQICAEKHPNFFLMRRELFQNQEKLDQGLMLSIALRHGLQQAELETCMKSSDTTARLEEDIRYARSLGIQGTPLVLLNGRVAPPAPAFLMGMALAKGDVDARYFLQLPPPPVD